jgi:hypothetical protein
MSISVDSRHAHYKDVLELNNIGVDLMEAKAYQSATGALREAIHVMKAVVQPVPENPLSLDAPPSLNTGGIFETRERLLHLQALLPRPNNPEAMHCLGTPIRIEATHMQCPDGQNPDMTSAVLLYNFGLMYRWAGFECSDPNGELKEGALRLFKMAYSILTDGDRMTHTEPEDMGGVKIFLLVQVLNVLSQIEGELGKHADANAHIEQLQRLGRFAIFKSRVDNVMHVPAAPAA